MIQAEVRSQLISGYRRLEAKGWLLRPGGGLSVRLNGASFAATPALRSTLTDLAEADLLEIASPPAAPMPIELEAHLRIYGARADAMAVVHALPPSATAVGCANQEMLTWALPEAVLSLGPGVPLAGVALPGSDPLWAEFDPLLPHYDAIMVGGNGVYAWGRSLDVALARLERVEHLAQVLLSSMALGGPRLLDAELVAELLASRAKAGSKLPPDPARQHWHPAS